MDEPLGALDKRLRDQLQGEIARLHRELGMTFGYVTHDQEEALALSDRIAVFHDGRVEQVGSAKELYEHPATLFVAEFLGESNVFPGEWRPQDGVLVGPGYRLSALERPSVPSPGALVVRPERIQLTPDSGGSGHPGGLAPALHGEVIDVVYLGQVRKVIVRLDCGPSVVARELAGRTSATENGDRVHVSWAREAATLVEASAVA